MGLTVWRLSLNGAQKMKTYLSVRCGTNWLPTQQSSPAISDHVSSNLFLRTWRTSVPRNT